MSRSREVQELADLIRHVGGLANAADLARDWDVSRERVSQVTRDSSFPLPVAEVGGRPAWARSEAHRWRARPAPRLRLHEAMELVLREEGGPMRYADLADAIARRDLYRRPKDGQHPRPGQLGARARKYPHLFNPSDDGSGVIRLR